MSESKRIKTALVSVYHKEGLDEIITKLYEEGVEFLSTGGTRQFIESLDPDSLSGLVFHCRTICRPALCNRYGLRNSGKAFSRFL